jgi:hypothetical protein
MRNRRITKSCFRTCSTCLSRSQAPFCLYTQRMITDHAEGTFESLRYCLGGDRPSQTTHLTRSLTPTEGAQVRLQPTPGRYFNGGSTTPGDAASGPPAYPTQALVKVNARLQ